MASVLEKVRAILDANYKALGWKLCELELTNSELIFGQIMQGTIVCPCGGREYFCVVVDESKFVAGAERDIATSILANTASPRHLQKDVTEGRLAAMDIDKHAFKGVLI